MVLIQRDSLSDQAYEYIYEKICSGEYPAGMRLKDSHLSEEMQISRTPIREAIRKLTEEGIIDCVKGRNYFVAVLTRKDVKDIFQAKRALDRYMVRKVMEEILPESPKAKKKLEALRDMLNKDVADGGDFGYAEHDTALRDTLLEILDNGMITQYYRLLTRKTQLLRIYTGNDSGKAEHSQREHLAILEGILSLNIDHTMELLEAHTLWAENHAMDYFED